MATTNIICVDDERPVLDSIMKDLERGLPLLSKKYGTEINIEGCQSGQECLDLLKECDERGEVVGCVLTDVRMPQMRGDLRNLRYHILRQEI